MNQPTAESVAVDRRKGDDIDFMRQWLRERITSDPVSEDTYTIIPLAYAFDEVWFKLKFGPFPEDAPYIARIEAFRESEHGS
jgi:hypothetical protein